MKITNRAQAWAIAAGFDSVLLGHPELVEAAEVLTRQLYKAGLLEGYPFGSCTSVWIEDLINQDVAA